MNLPENINDAGLTGKDGQPIASIGEAVNNAMSLIEEQSEQLVGILPKSYTDFSPELLTELLRIFNNSALDDIGGDIIGRIYEYFLSKFAPVVASDDGVFFTPKSLVKMIVNILEPKSGILLDCACGSGGMFVASGDFVNNSGMNANSTMTFYGQEKVDYNAQLAQMNMAVHGLSGKIKSGDDANTFYNDAYNLAGSCDYVMANPPFNVDKVKAEAAESAGRLPFGLPSVNKKSKEVGNANYLWISYFYAYLNERGRAGFVMASSATDSQGKDKDIREELVKTGHVDVMISVGNNFFYTKSLPCSLWFYDKGKRENLKDKVLLIDARNYYTVVDRTLNEWSEWQIKNLSAIVWLYRGEKEKYKNLITEYHKVLGEDSFTVIAKSLEEKIAVLHNNAREAVEKAAKREKKKTQAAWDEKIAEQEELLTIAKEAVWLCEKFSCRANGTSCSSDSTDSSMDVEGEYRDILGLCKVATLTEIEEKNYSLTPGAYVGVAPAEDDGVDFKSRMQEIHSELAKLQAESNSLMATIEANFKELGL